MLRSGYCTSNCGLVAPCIRKEQRATAYSGPKSIPKYPVSSGFDVVPCLSLQILEMVQVVFCGLPKVPCFLA